MSRNVVKKPEKEEIRSKRLPILLKESVHKEFKEKCNEMGISMNECVNQLIENWMK